MKPVVNLQLKPTAKQVKSPRDTLERCTAACNEISQRGFYAPIRSAQALYANTRKVFDLTAQAAVRCIAKVADAYAAQKTRGREKSLVRFRKHDAQPYDDRIFRFVADGMVSIWTLSGRQKIPFVCGDHQRLLAFRKRAEVDVEGVLAGDFGIVNLTF